MPLSKNRVKEVGVYVIEDKTNEKVYVGSTIDKHIRFKDHRKHLRAGSHYNPGLQEAFNNNHNFETTFYPTGPAVNVREAEDVIISKYIDSGLLYNVMADPSHPTYKRKLPEETIERMKKPKAPEAVAKAALAHQKPVVVESVRYESVKSAAEAHGIKPKIVSKRLHSSLDRYADWTFETKD